MKTLKSVVLGMSIAAAALSVPSSFGANVVAGFSSNTLVRNDDDSTGPVAIGFTANFFGTNYSSLFVNNNGNVTFDFALSTFTPFELSSANRVIIAPFFADVDTTNPLSGEVHYGTGTFGGRNAFGASYSDVGVGVGYFPGAADKLNIFQVLLVDRSDIAAGDFDIYFNYDQIQWETGNASGGSGGLGGNSARAGYSNGTPANSFEIAGSAINGAFLDSNQATGLIHSSNIGVDGRFLFQVRNGNVTTPGNGVPDSGSTIALLGLTLLGLAIAKRTRR